MIKRVLIGLVVVALIVISLLVGYVIYLQINYYRLEDNIKLQIEERDKSLENQVYTNKTYKIITYNVGFGAYDRDYSFFMDKAIRDVDNKMIKGKYGRAVSKERVINNINNVNNILNDNLADFYIVQEVDTNSTRSFNVDQVSNIVNGLSNKNFNYTYAVNYHSSYLALPLFNMLGYANSGLLTISNVEIKNALRRSYPVSTNFVSKFFDLDRCFSVNELNVDNGKKLVIVNQHMSAYDKGGVIRKKQLDMLNVFLQNQKEAGNYVIVGGDFNHDYCDSKALHIGDKKIPTWLAIMSDKDLCEGYKFIKPDNINDTGSCRGAESPYNKETTYQSTIDGFIVSDNIEATSHIIDTEYLASDHNPVLMEYKLNNK